MAKRRYRSPSPVVHENSWTIPVRKDVIPKGKLRRVQERVQLLPTDRGEREARKSLRRRRRLANRGFKPLSQGQRQRSGGVHRDDGNEHASVQGKLGIFNCRSRALTSAVCGDSFAFPMVQISEVMIAASSFWTHNKHITSACIWLVAAERAG